MIPRPLTVSLVLAAAAAVIASCSGSDTDLPMATLPVVVSIESQRCTRPQPRFGVGTLVADGVVLTAAHVVDGELRRLEVDGVAASVVASSPATDLALVASDGAPAAAVRDARGWFDTIEHTAPVTVVAPAAVTIVGADASRPTAVERVVTLRVDDVSAGVVHERRALEMGVLVEPGDSGSPVIDDAGRLIGVVTLRRPGTESSYATRVPAVADHARRGHDPGPGTDAVAREGTCT